MESEGVKDDNEEFMLLKKHIDKLNSRREYKRAQKIFIPENNLGLEASHLHTMVKRYKDVTTFWEKEHKPGVCKTAQRTVDYQFLITSMLFDGFLGFERDLFTSSKGQTPEKIKNLLREQLERYHWERKKASDHFGRDRWTMTGKMGDKQDDLYVTVAMCAFFGRSVIKNPRRMDRLKR